MKSSEDDVEGILGLGSFEKGLRAELRGRLREEQGKMLVLVGIFALGIITGFWISEKKRGE